MIQSFCTILEFELATVVKCYMCAFIAGEEVSIGRAAAAAARPSLTLNQNINHCQWQTVAYNIEVSLDYATLDMCRVKFMSSTR